MSDVMQCAVKPPIDEGAFAALEEIAEGEVGFLVELLSQYLSDAQQLMIDLQAGAAAGDAQQIERAGHTLKSASANMGALTLTAFCEALQVKALSSDLEGLPELVANTDVEYSRVCADLRQRLRKLGD